ncbi:MAG: hypothetical protein JNL83_20410 [Myxococcales bacterium]|nr:hypothetical protein [Myxococcales bacterium]
MAKKQTRRSISVSRTTYERLKAFCEANNISMSQLVETRVNDFLGDGPAPSPGATPAQPRPSAITPSAPRPTAPTPGTPTKTSAVASSGAPVGSTSERPTSVSNPVIPMTSAAARFAVDPPPPIIKPKQQETNAPKPAEKRPDQIFTF